MRTSIHIVGGLTGLLAVASAVQAQPKSASSSPRRTATVAPRPPLHEPSESTSTLLRAEQEDRRRLRAEVDWRTLNPGLQEALWDTFVGPDQLDDGTGHAQVRPSERSGEFDDRDDGYGERDDLTQFPLTDFHRLCAASNASGLTYPSAACS